MPVQQSIQQQQANNQVHQINTSLQQPTLVNLSSSKVDSGPLSEVKILSTDELSLRDKKLLRKQRFLLNKEQNITTAEALEQMKIDKEKRIERAMKFGVPSKEIEQEKRKERALKFGLPDKPDKETQNEKLQERAKKFSMGGTLESFADKDKLSQRQIRFTGGSTQPAATNQEDEEKKKQRAERFGDSIENQGRVVKRLKQ